MKLRNQIILAFFLFSVLPLTGVTLYSYYTSRQAFRQAVAAENTVRARDMERRMGEVTDDLQHRIERVSGMPYWASLAPGAPQPDEWNVIIARLQSDLGSAAGLVDHIEFTPAEPLVPAPGERGGNPEVPLPEGAASAPTLVRIRLPKNTESEHRVVVERIGDKLVVHQQSVEVLSYEEGAAPEGKPATATESKMEAFKGGLLALSRELESRDQQRRAGIDVPVAGPGEFEVLLASEIGSAVLRDGRTVGTVRAEVSTRELLRRVLSRTKEGSGEIPFAVDAEGNLYTPDPADLSHLEPLALPARVSGARMAAGDETDPNWVTVFETDDSSNLTFGIARPVGESLDKMRTTAATNLAIGLALVGLALGGILPLSSRMTRKLDQLTQGAERLGAGDLEAQVPLRGRDEFGKLAATFNRMARQLGENQRRLVVQERLRRELELCRQIQDELLPSGTYRSPQAHVRGVSIPAKELGGDFFNYFPLDGGQLGILVGDVSGKGVGAAILMANVQATLRARLPVERDLARLTDSLDHDIAQNTPDEVYLTLFLGILDPERKHLRYVNAGHSPPLAVHRDGRVDHLPPGGRPPGLLPGGGYREESVALEDGDSLFLYTDGLVEAEDGEGRAFGVERLEKLLLQERTAEIEVVLEKVQEALREHQGGDEAADDATLVVLRVPAGAATPVGAGAAG
jgi:serine phosphatase RsbU (regulator of sigma subunit)